MAVRDLLFFVLCFNFCLEVVAPSSPEKMGPPKRVLCKTVSKRPGLVDYSQYCSGGSQGLDENVEAVITSVLDSIVNQVDTVVNNKIDPEAVEVRTALFVTSPRLDDRAQAADLSTMPALSP